MKLVTSVLSLESEEDIEVSAQNKLLILLFPKQILLLPVEIDPEGEEPDPAAKPKHKLLSPVVISSPVVCPIASLDRDWETIIFV